MIIWCMSTCTSAFLFWNSQFDAYFFQNSQFDAFRFQLKQLFWCSDLYFNYDKLLSSYLHSFNFFQKNEKYNANDSKIDGEARNLTPYPASPQPATMPLPNNSVSISFQFFNVYNWNKLKQLNESTKFDVTYYDYYGNFYYMKDIKNAEEENRKKSTPYPGAGASLADKSPPPVHNSVNFYSACLFIKLRNERFVDIFLWKSLISDEWGVISCLLLQTFNPWEKRNWSGIAEDKS